MSFKGGTKGQMSVRVPNFEREGIPEKRTLVRESARTKRLSVERRLG